MSVVLICPRTSQPRYHKRELSLRSLCQTRVAAFRRPYYRENFFADGVDFVSLGDIEDGNYAARTFAFGRAVRRLAETRRQGELMYALSIDCYLLGRIAGLGRGILEVGDLRTIDSRNLLVRRLERWVVHDCAGLIVTSPEFVSEYLGRFVPRGCTVYAIENKLDRCFKGVRPANWETPSATITIGLVGLLRYRRPIEMLIRAVKENEGLRLKCYGDGPDRDVVQANAGERIEYFGPFRNPQDLARVYQGVDVNFVVYDVNSGNVRLAMPNKYYESVFFGVPLLAAKGTALGRQVSKLSVGAELDTSSYEAFYTGLAATTREWVESCRRNCMAVPEEQLLDEGTDVLTQVLADMESRKPNR